MTESIYGSPIYPAPRRRSRTPFVLLAVGVLIVAAVAGYLLYRGARPKPVTVTGTMSLPGDGFDTDGASACTGRNGYEDIREGANVVIHDAAGKVIATGALAAGVQTDFDDQGGILIKAVPNHCSFAFRVAGVPRQKFYGVEVSHRGSVTFTAAQVDGSQIALSLGS